MPAAIGAARLACEVCVAQLSSRCVRVSGCLLHQLWIYQNNYAFFCSCLRDKHWLAFTLKRETPESLSSDRCFSGNKNTWNSQTNDEFRFTMDELRF